VVNPAENKNQLILGVFDLKWGKTVAVGKNGFVFFYQKSDRRDREQK